MEYRYAPQINKQARRPRRQTPEHWISGPDPYLHEIYYAWLKHRSQAQYRGEGYELTWEDWQQVWRNPQDFFNRGRQPENVVLTRHDIEKAWSLDNCLVITRLEQLRRDSVAKNIAKKKKRNDRSKL